MEGDENVNMEGDENANHFMKAYTSLILIRFVFRTLPDFRKKNRKQSKRLQSFFTFTFLHYFPETKVALIFIPRLIKMNRHIENHTKPVKSNISSTRNKKLENKNRKQ